MNRKHNVFIALILLSFILPPAIALAGGPLIAALPPLDPILMAFKDQGVWYFFCFAPQFPYRIPPHYFSLGPPPPLYCPPPCAPVPWHIIRALRPITDNVPTERFSERGIGPSPARRSPDSGY